MTVIIREATVDDIPAMLPLAKRFFDGSCYGRYLDFADDRVTAFFGEMIATPSAVVLVAVRDGAIVGGIAGGVVTPYFSTMPICQELAWFTDPGHRFGLIGPRLLLRLRQWGQDRGASAFAVCHMGEDTHIGDWLVSKGFSPMEATFWGPM